MRVLVPLLAPLALLLPGCLQLAAPPLDAAGGAPLAGVPTLGVVHDAAGNALDAFPAGMVAAIGGQYPTGFAAAEPTIGATSSGAIFITGLSPNPSCKDCPVVPYATFRAGPTILRTTDGGQTWEDVFPKLPTGDSMKLRTWDPYVLVDRATDRVFMDDIYPLGCGALSFSDDEGASWWHNPASCGNPQVNDHQTLVAATPRRLPTSGYPNLVYRCVNNLAYNGCAISVDGGRSFLPQIPVRTGCSALTGHLEADAEGRVYLPLACGARGLGNGYPGVAVTEDDGATWTVRAIHKEHRMDDHDVDLAVDAEGTLHAMWLSEGLPHIAWSADQGATWSPPRQVSPPGVTATWFNAIGAGDAGKVAFAYIGTTRPGGYGPREEGGLPLLPSEPPSGWENATWNAYVGVLLDAKDPQAPIQTVTANDPADPLARGYCGRTRCNGMTDFIDLVVDGAGRPWASFVDVCVRECVTDPKVPYDGNVGFAATLRAGPALRGEATALPEIAPPPAAG